MRVRVAKNKIGSFVQGSVHVILIGVRTTARHRMSLKWLFETNKLQYFLSPLRTCWEENGLMVILSGFETELLREKKKGKKDRNVSVYKR